MYLTDVTPEQIDAETERVVATTEGLTDEQLREPSLCTGWSRGHVLSHLARNADALARVYAVAVTGVPDTMYDSDTARDAEVDAGAGRSGAEQVTDLRESAGRLTVAVRQFDPSQEGVRVERTPGGRHILVERVAYMRLRELIYHHVDLDAGYTFEQVAPDVLAMFLADAVKRLEGGSQVPGMRIQTDEGDEFTLGSGETMVRGPRAGVLRWLAREDAGGLRFDGPVPTLPFGG